MRWLGDTALGFQNWLVARPVMGKFWNFVTGASMKFFGNFFRAEPVAVWWRLVGKAGMVGKSMGAFSMGPGWSQWIFSFSGGFDFY
jgi:hypothetical protein